MQHTPPPIQGQKIGAEVQFALCSDGVGTRTRHPCCIAAPAWAWSGFGALVVYFFATWSSLVHNSGASD